MTDTKLAEPLEWMTEPTKPGKYVHKDHPGDLGCVVEFNRRGGIRKRGDCTPRDGRWLGPLPEIRK